MTETAHWPTMDSVRGARRRVYDQLEEEMHALGADPATIAHDVVTMSGQQFLERWLRTEIPPPPPLAVLFAMEWVEIEPGRVALSIDPPDWMYTHLGTMHGGITATLLDTVIGSSIHTTLPAGTGYATSDLHVRYLRAVTPDAGRLFATATAVHTGRRHATAEGRVEVEATGKLVATGTAGCAIIGPA